MLITFHVIPNKTRQITFLRKCIREASEVILALDDDREGESIAWHICDLFKLPIHTTKRTEHTNIHLFQILDIRTTRNTRLIPST